METEIIITLSLIAFSGIFKAISDLISENNFQIPWLNKDKSWKFKYKLDEFGDPVKDFDTNKLIERFWGSSRWFSFITDGWHLSNFFQYRCIDFAIIVNINLSWYYILSLVFILPVVRGVTFEIIYRWKNIK